MSQLLCEIALAREAKQQVASMSAAICGAKISATLASYRLLEQTISPILAHCPASLAAKESHRSGQGDLDARNIALN
jgi:hypothetical protein